MPPPSQLSIATSSLQRLIKEEASYHREMEMQQKSIDRLERGEQDEEEEEAESGNREYLLGQEVTFFLPCSIFPPFLSFFIHF
jgi:tubulin-specific chaperone A